MSDKHANTSAQKLSFRQWGILATILVMYFFAPDFGAISPTLMLMPEYYGVSPSAVSWISAFANPTACVAGLCIGAFTGKRISYRACTITATALYFIFGGLPFLWQDIPFAGLLCARALFGFGCGCLVPISQAVITRMFKSETARSAWIGVINIIFSIGASVGSIIVGFLARGGVWQNGYAFYLFAAVPFLMAIIFFRDKDIVGDATSLTERQVVKAERVGKRKVPRVAILFIISYTFSTLLTQTFFNYAGIAMNESGCDPLLVGTVFTAFTVAGIVVAAANAGLWKFLRIWNYPLAFVLITLGYVLCLIGYGSGAINWFFAASIIMGIGCCIAGMVMPMVMSVTVTASALTLAIGLQEVARNLGSFLSAPWLNLVGSTFGDTASFQFGAAVVLGIGMIIVASLLAIKNNRKFKNIDMSQGEAISEDFVSQEK